MIIEKDNDNDTDKDNKQDNDNDTDIDNKQDNANDNEKDNDQDKNKLRRDVPSSTKKRLKSIHNPSTFASWSVYSN